jgi:aminoglycoside phosphotransferase (APT) family kinase protein
MLEQNGLAGVPERPFPNDGWSGATLTVLERGRDRFILKRTSPALDWIVRATQDVALREGFVAGNQLLLVEPLVAPYLGTASDGAGVAILMPDLSAELIAWERPGHDPVVPQATLERVIEAVARLHAMPWAEYRPTTPDWHWPWCPLRERLLLLTRPAAERYRAEGLAVGGRFLAGWDAFDRAAPASARELVERLSADPSALLDALARLPGTGLHGDLKLANIAIFDDGRVALIDWQMMTLAPIAVELGWMLVANSASLPIAPDELLESYRLAAGRAALDSMHLAGSWREGDTSRRPESERIAGRFGTLPPRGLDATIGDWEAQVDLVWIVGLLLRGWRKGLDAESGVLLGSGVTAVDDLAWWSRRAVEAAQRRL